MAKKKPKKPSNNIAFNKKARHDYSIEEKFEAGMVLQGWEVKSLREGKCQMVDSYVFIKNAEAWISNLLITPLITASTHVKAEGTRVRKLLLHRAQIDKLLGAVKRKGYTIVPLSIYWSNGRTKIEIGLAKGQAEHDKRANAKDRDWQRDKQRLMKHNR